VVAIGTADQVLGSNLPPLVNTVKVGTAHAFGTTWNVKDSWSADGYQDYACVEPASASTSDPCDRPLGNGISVQIFSEPAPDVFISAYVGYRADIRMNDGTVFHAFMLDVPAVTGGTVAVFALEGAGSGRLIYHLGDGRIYEGPRVRWPDLGQVIGDGSFPPPDTP
jgi:hypothetical protein